MELLKIVTEFINRQISLTTDQSTVVIPLEPYYARAKDPGSSTYSEEITSASYCRTYIIIRRK